MIVIHVLLLRFGCPAVELWWGHWSSQSTLTAPGDRPTVGDGRPLSLVCRLFEMETATTEEWLVQTQARLDTLQATWDSMQATPSPASSPSSSRRPPARLVPAPFSVPGEAATPRRQPRSTIIPVHCETPEGLARKARVKAREQQRAQEAEDNRRRILEHHRNLKELRSGRRSIAQVADGEHSARPGSAQQSTPSAKFQNARKELRRSLAGTPRQINVEFIVAKQTREPLSEAGDGSVGEEGAVSRADLIKEMEETRSLVAGTLGEPLLNQATTQLRAGASDDHVANILAQFGEFHDLRAIKRLLYLEDAFFG
ncbi:unnamed protein product (mitochondrion) [Plasmodiophora brassicae]|uniref:Uncharacterized protein n=1 Tax=Plasmodiophora brassicae TaxID=37360 RepID=A0A3P3Y5R2_PLABS|nr:unnamed protein product [Plasmodiophora brassicae]